MKKVLAITCLLVLCIASVAMASETDWRFQIKTDDGAGLTPAPVAHIGVKANMSDLVDTVAVTQDLEAAYGTDTTQKLLWTVGVIPGNTKSWLKDIYSPAAPSTYTDGVKRWELRSFGGPSAANSVMRLQFFTLGSTTMPLANLAGKPVTYKVTLFDNKGKAGAPANNTSWTFNAPTAHSTTVPFFTLTLPALSLDSYGHPNAISQGYGLYFDAIQEVTPPAPVPEPAGLMALGTGMVGLLGFASRRRRA